MQLPKKILSRKTEITAEFLEQVEIKLQEILSGKAERMFHIKDIAALMYIHPVHLSKTIQLTTGNSPCFFWEEKLMMEARRLLSEGQCTIAVIAGRLLLDTSNFTKFFKRQEGMTPTAFRERETLRQWETKKESILTP